MSDNKTDLQSRVKVLRLLQWLSPIAMTVIAIIIYLTLEPNLNVIVASVVFVIGVMDVLVFKFVADRAEQEL